MSVKVDVQGMDGVLALFDPKKMARATRNAVNATATVYRKESVKEAVKVFNLAKKRISKDSDGKTTYIVKARAGGDEARITYRGKRPGLHNFSTNKKGVKRKSKPKFRIKRSGSLKTLERGFFEKTGFGAGSVGLFQRVGKERYPIVRRAGPSIKQMYENKDVRVKLESGLMWMFTKSFDEKLRAQAGR